MTSPSTIATAPITAHAASPLMNEPPIHPTPWPTHTAPTRHSATPITNRTTRSSNWQLAGTPTETLRRACAGLPSSTVFTRPRLSCTRRLLAVVGLALGAAVPVVATSTQSAGAALRPVSGCGFTFGRTSGQGAAGTLFFSVSLRPANPAQRCSVAVTFTATITNAATGHPYANIDHDPLTATQTVSFAPGRESPVLNVGWGGFHCADPPGPGTFSLAAAGAVTATPISTESCGPVGTSHSALESFPVQTDSVVGIGPTPDNLGYRTVDQLGNVNAHGDATAVDVATNAPSVAIATAPTGNGYWVASADGGVFAVGSAAFHGSLGARHLNQPIVGMAATPDGGGYWLVASDGGVFAFGDAAFHGSLGALHLNAPVVAMAATPDGGGYWLVAEDGGVFAFGDAAFQGSMGAVVLNAPVVGMAADPHGGYWIVASDGGIFGFGGAPFEGSTGAITLNEPISAMAATSTGHGYWLVGADNGIFTFGDAQFFGSNPTP